MIVTRIPDLLPWAMLQEESHAPFSTLQMSRLFLFLTTYWRGGPSIDMLSTHPLHHTSIIRVRSRTRSRRLPFLPHNFRPRKLRIMDEVVRWSWEEWSLHIWPESRVLQGSSFIITPFIHFLLVSHAAYAAKTKIKAIGTDATPLSQDIHRLKPNATDGRRKV